VCSKNASQLALGGEDLLQQVLDRAVVKAKLRLVLVEECSVGRVVACG